MGINHIQNIVYDKPHNDILCKNVKIIVIKSVEIEPGMVAHACNPSTWEAETGGSRFVASLSYLVRPSTTS